MNRITVLLADDHMIVREGFKVLLESQVDIQVVGEAHTGRAAVEFVQKNQPAVVVMDIGMPLLNGMEATRQILRDHPATKVIMLSAYDDDEYVERVVAIGAMGYLLKRGSAHKLAAAIRDAAKGKLVLDETIAARRHKNAAKAAVNRSAVGKNNNQLSTREGEVLQLIAEGAPNKEIASELGISIKTIEKHRQRLMNKLNIHNTAGLTRYAIATGVIEGRVPVSTE